MMKMLIEKELKSILLSPKFPATFLVCSVLIISSVWIGIREYYTGRAQYETATQLVREEMRAQANWASLDNRIYRKPEPMQIFSSGVANDIGRWSPVNSFNAIKLRNSPYSDDPIYAVFRYMDIAFIVQVILTLFALLFTYDAVNGEREGGTLQLVFANALPRARYIIAKGVGAWLGLVLPLSLPFAISVLLLFLYRVPLSLSDWEQLGVFAFASLFLFTFFIGLGVFLSAAIRRSNISFLAALVCWVVLALIVPRVGVMMAGRMIPTPSAAEVDARQDGYAKDRWELWKKQLEDRWDARNVPMKGMSKDDAEAYRQSHMWAWMVEDDSLRGAVQKDIDANQLKMQEDLRNRERAQQRLAFFLARFSPISAYQLAVMNVAGTDIGLKDRFEDALNQYRPTYTSFIDKKQKESGGMGGIRITFDSDKGFKFDLPRETGSLDLSELPQFADPPRVFSQAAASAIVDLGLLAGSTLLILALGFVMFMRVDLR